MDSPNKRYVVRLEPEERERLQRLVSVGKAAARKLTHARVVLQSDESTTGPGWTDKQIAEGLGVGGFEEVAVPVIEPFVKPPVKTREVGPEQLREGGGDVEMIGHRFQKLAHFFLPVFIGEKLDRHARRLVGHLDLIGFQMSEALQFGEGQHRAGQASGARG